MTLEMRPVCGKDGRNYHSPSSARCSKTVQYLIILSNNQIENLFRGRRKWLVLEDAHAKTSRLLILNYMYLVSGAKVNL